METVIQAVSAVLIAVILSLTLEGKQLSMLLGMSVCVIVLLLGMSCLEPVVDFLQELKALGNLSGDMLSILLKVAGISIVSEIAALICTDSGNTSMCKALQILTTVVVLCLSLPIFQALLDLIRRILEDV